MESLPLVTAEFKKLLESSESLDTTLSFSLAEALTRQDLFQFRIANLGGSLLWQLFREGMLFNRGLFLNLKEFKT